MSGRRAFLGWRAVRVVVELSEADRALLERLVSRIASALKEAPRRDTGVGAASADARPPGEADAGSGADPQRAEEGQRADAARASVSPQADGEDVGVSHRPPAPSGNAQKAGRKWTSERIAVVRTMWPTMVRSTEILERLNALPGSEVMMSQLQSYASVQLHLHRPNGAPRGTPMVPPIGSPLRPDGHSPRPAPVTAAQLRNLIPAEADFDTVRWWAGEHGIPAFDGSVFMLAEVNAKRLRVGLNPFKLVRRA